MQPSRFGAGKLAPLFTEYWTFDPSWLLYVKNTWKGLGRVEQIKTETKESLEFKERAKQAFLSRDIQFRLIKTYLSVQKPNIGSGYDEQYPHIHYPLDATTLVHYLQPGDIPAPLDIFDGDEVVQTIIPERGLTVFIPNCVKHGVMKNQGKEDRIQLIATALR